MKASFSPGNKGDRQQLELTVKNLSGTVPGDRGYISQILFQQPLEQWVFMVTRVRQNIKNKLMSMLDKILLLKRALIESFFGKIKLLGIG